VTDDEWSGTVEMLLGLNSDPYSYQDITDNPWPFKTRNMGKDNDYIMIRNRAQYYWWAQNEPELLITESRPYDYAQHYTYMGWYYKRVMATIWYDMYTDDHLSQSLPHPEEPVDELSYVPHSHRTTRAVSI
jgi:hypothetical protein